VDSTNTKTHSQVKKHAKTKQDLNAHTFFFLSKILIMAINPL